ncbi:MAG: phosphatidate cytidylyltransferase [Pseudomonadota bacterium]
MLKQRLLTAALLIPLVVLGVLLLPDTYFALAVGLVVALAAWEWAGLLKWSAPLRAAYVVFLCAILVGVYHAPILWIVAPALLGWALAAAWVIGFPFGKSVWSAPAVAALLGLLVLVPSWVALLAMRDMMTPYMVLFLLSFIWLGDSAAYFAGRRWGKTKLAARISPGKTWEGVYGAVVAVVIYALAVQPWLAPHSPPWMFALLCLLTLLVSVIGDLFKSMFKRHAGVKDSGHLLPGHGGILDRIDSLTAAAPVFLAGLLLLGQRA